MSISVESSPDKLGYNTAVVDFYISNTAIKLCNQVHRILINELESGSYFRQIEEKYIRTDLYTHLKEQDVETLGAFDELLQVTLNCIKKKQPEILRMTNGFPTSTFNDSGMLFLSSFVYKELTPMLTLLKIVDPEALKYVSSWSSIQWSVLNTP